MNPPMESSGEKLIPPTATRQPKQTPNSPLGHAPPAPTQAGGTQGPATFSPAGRGPSPRGPSQPPGPGGGAPDNARPTRSGPPTVPPFRPDGGASAEANDAHKTKPPPVTRPGGPSPRRDGSGSTPAPGPSDHSPNRPTPTGFTRGGPSTAGRPSLPPRGGTATTAPGLVVDPAARGRLSAMGRPSRPAPTTPPMTGPRRT